MVTKLQETLFSQLADFIVSQPSLETLANYQVPESIQERIDYLLEKNAEARISSDERQELEKILTIADLLNLAKVKARLKLAEKL